MATVLTVIGVLLAIYGVAMALLYPAGGFFLVWLALGAALVAAARVERARVVICAALLVVLLAAGALCGLIASAAATRPPAGLDYLVVLGAGLRPDGSPSETLRYRLDSALAYLDENPETTCVVSGGQGVGESRPEADAMAEYLVANGLDEGRIVREARSTSTVENIRYTSELVPADATAAIVTNDFHLYRALRTAEKNGMAGVYGLAAPSNPLYLPHAALRECCAIVKDALVGNI